MPYWKTIKRKGKKPKRVWVPAEKNRLTEHLFPLTLASESNGKNNNGKGKKTPSLDVAAPVTLDIYNYFFGQRTAEIIQNEDYILRKEAGSKGIAIYDEMEDKDPQIAGCIDTRKRAVSGMSWEIVAASDDARDKEIAAFCEDEFRSLPQFEEDLYELLDGVAKGYSVSEILWKVRPDMKYGIQRIESRHQRRFVFGVNGDLRLVTPESPLVGVPVPPYKFLTFRHNSKAENPYGNAVLKRCYWFFIFKKTGIKFWSIFLERFGQPTVHVKRPSGMVGESQKKLEKFVSKMQQNTVWLTDSDVEIELMETTKTASQSYRDFEDFCDEQIAKAIVGQTMTTDVQSGGSFAKAKVGNSVRLEWAQADAQNLSAVISDQLLKWLVEVNFANVKKFPQFVLHSEPKEDLTERLKRDLDLATAGLEISKDYFRLTYGLPAPEEGDEVLEPPSFGFIDQNSEGQENLRSKKKIIRLQGSRGERGRGIPQIPKRPDNLRQYDLRSVANIRRRFAQQLDTLFESLSDDLQKTLRDNRPTLSLVEDFIMDKMPRKLQRILEDGNLEALKTGARGLADAFGKKLDPQIYRDLVTQYAKRHAYDLGSAREKAGVIQEIMSNRIKDLFESDKGIEKLRDDILAEFGDITRSRAQMIATTETQMAANWAGIQAVKKLGLEVEAWFVGDTTEEPLCLELLAGNPHTLKVAEEELIPHPNCIHSWGFSLKEET